MSERTKYHYIKIFHKNPNATIGLLFAAQAVYASKYGVFNNKSIYHNTSAFQSIAYKLKTKYGDNLTVEQVQYEMEVLCY